MKLLVVNPGSTSTKLSRKKKKKYPFYTALSQAYELYGVELDEDTFETYAMSAW